MLQLIEFGVIVRKDELHKRFGFLMSSNSLPGLDTNKTTSLTHKESTVPVQ